MSFKLVERFAWVSSWWRGLHGFSSWWRGLCKFMEVRGGM